MHLVAWLGEPTRDQWFSQGLSGRPHPEGQNEEETEKKLGKITENWLKWGGKMRKVELLPTRDCEASYCPAGDQLQSEKYEEELEKMKNEKQCENVTHPRLEVWLRPWP